MKQLILNQIIERYGHSFEPLFEQIPSVVTSLWWRCKNCKNEFEASVSQMRQRKNAGYESCWKCDPPKHGRPFSDLVGRAIAGFMVLEKEGDSYWCLCRSQHKILLPQKILVEKHPTCMQCLQNRPTSIVGDPVVLNGKIQLIGHRFGKLVVVEEMEPQKRMGKSSDRISGMKIYTSWRWKCQCDCGSYIVVNTGKLQKGRRVSCGRCGMITIGDRRFGSILEAAIYLKLKQDGVEFSHNQEYPQMGRKRYDFFIPSTNTYIETSSFNPESRAWNSYYDRIREKKRHVETILGGKFEFINRTCTKEERIQVFSKLI